MSINLEELLGKVRDHYLTGYRRAIGSYRERFTPGGPEVLLETDQSAPLVYRYYRMDLASGSTNPPDMTEVNLDSHLEFEPLTFDHDGLEVRLTPVVWNGVECRVEPALAHDADLQAWALRWVDPEERAVPDSDGLGAYVHSVTVPRSDATGTTFSIDFGSAPVQSVLELLSVLRKAGVRSVALHSQTMLGP